VIVLAAGDGLGDGLGLDRTARAPAGWDPPKVSMVMLAAATTQMTTTAPTVS
jgi:hypothetical protein